MRVKVLMTAENQPDWKGDSGPMPAPVITLDTQIYSRAILEQKDKDANGS